MSIELRGKNAIVTGAAVGLGQAYARTLAQAAFGRTDILVNNAGVWGDTRVDDLCMGG